LKAQVEQVKLQFVKSLPSLWELRLEQKINLNAYLLDLCLNPDSPLPYLARYLQSLTQPPHNLPLLTPKDILQALEHPVYFHKLPQHTKDAWNCYLDDRTRHFRLNYIKMLTAEAWLQTDANHRHGGKRR
jgi:hypothetical protein